MSSFIIASSSRSALSQFSVSTSKLSTIQFRTVIHHARPPRVPVLRSPHDPKQPLPTSGTSHPNPSISSSSASATTLTDSNLTLHYAPPPTAPSYTTGVIPPFLQWLNGSPVELSGEEIAPIKKARKSIVKPSSTEDVEGSISTQSLQEELGWTEEFIARMVELRIEGKSVKQIGENLDIPEGQRRLIPRFASLSKEQKQRKGEALALQKEGWGFHKRLAREVRQKRKDFW